MQRVEGIVKSFASSIICIDDDHYHCNFVLPFFPGDYIKILVSGKKIIQFPCVLVPTDFTACKRYITSKNSQKILNKLYEEYPENLFEFLDHMVFEWKTHRTTPYGMKNIVGKHSLNAKFINDVLYAWYKNRVQRQCQLLLIEPTKLNMPLCDFINMLAINPFHNLNLDFAKCNTLRKIFFLPEPSELEIKAANKVREISNSLGSANFVYWIKKDDEQEVIDFVLSKYDLRRINNYLIFNKHFNECKVIKNFIQGLLSLKKEENIQCVFQNTNLTDEQKSAVESCLTKHIVIVNGGAGTGKTTVLCEIIQQLKLRNKNFFVSSFTGKAISRIRSMMSEKNCEIENNLATIHMLLYSRRNNIDRKEINTLIIDETSMVSIGIISSLLLFYPEITQLILIGDENQLPPIDSGSFYNELLKIKSIPCITLSQNLRNEDEDFFDLIEYNGKYEQIFNFYADKCEDKMSITILSSRNENLKVFNDFAQQYHNKDKQFMVDLKGNKWYEGDRVMMTKNNYNEGIMNGNEGIITEVNSEFIIIDFEHKKNVNFYNSFSSDCDKNTICNLTLSYALTVHKSQGSEWKNIIFFIPQTDYSFITKNMYYTALTRSKIKTYVFYENPVPDKFPNAYQRRKDILSLLFNQ